MLRINPGFKYPFNASDRDSTLMKVNKSKLFNKYQKMTLFYC